MNLNLGLLSNRCRLYEVFPENFVNIRYFCSMMASFSSLKIKLKFMLNIEIKSIDL
jgi:hypothetical protein